MSSALYAANRRRGGGSSPPAQAASVPARVPVTSWSPSGDQAIAVIGAVCRSTAISAPGLRVEDPHASVVAADGEPRAVVAERQPPRRQAATRARGSSASISATAPAARAGRRG